MHACTHTDTLQAGMCSQARGAYFSCAGYVCACAQEKGTFNDDLSVPATSCSLDAKHLVLILEPPVRLLSMLPRRQELSHWQVSQPRGRHGRWASISGREMGPATNVSEAAIFRTRLSVRPP